MTDPHLPLAAHHATERTLDWSALAATLGPARPELESETVSETASPVHVIAVDGFSGSGKTWFADRLAQTLHAPVYHVDEFVPGWDALADGLSHVSAHLLTPWAQGRAARVREYDWHEAQPGPWVRIDAAPIVVLEGSGIGTVDRSLLGSLVWVDTPQGLREDRLAARSDHELYLPYRAMWAAQERTLATGARTPDRADVVVHEADEARVRTSCRRSERT